MPFPPKESRRETDFETRLRRRVPLEIVPIRQERTHNLAIIASLFFETPDDITRYTQTVLGEFAGADIGVQFLFADNTPNLKFSGLLSDMERTLAEHGIYFSSVPVTNRGKIHGLNALLASVMSDYVMPVDPNKLPARGTLRGLYERASSSGFDLISSRVARTPDTGNPIQWYNTGAAYIGKRECFTGFPPVLNDDRYIHLLTLARGGSFAVATDLTVSDGKQDRISHEEQKRRRARHIVGDLQVQFLEVTDGAQIYRLGEQHVSFWKSLATETGLKTIVEYFKQLPPEKLVRFPVKALIAMLRIQKIDPFIQSEVHAQLQALLDNPELCVWEV